MNAAPPPVHFRTEQSVVVPAGQVELRRYFWSQPLAQTLHAMSDALVLNMALTARPARTRVDPLEHDADPLALEAGRLLVMIPGAPYHLVAPSGALRSLHCAIACTTFEAIAGEPIDWPSLAPFAGESRAAAGLEGHMVRIHQELVRNRIGRDAAIGASMELICVELLRRFRQGRPARPDVHRGGLAAWRMRAILARVHADAPAPRVVELATLCGLTERQLSRAFKAETGLTIGRFIDEATMERAHRLLATPGQPVATVARALGFASADSFVRSYRRITGAAPRPLR